MFFDFNLATTVLQLQIATIQALGSALFIALRRQALDDERVVKHAVLETNLSQEFIFLLESDNTFSVMKIIIRKIVAKSEMMNCG